MKTFRNLAAAAALITLVDTAMLRADTVIELDSNRETATFMSNGKKARINTRGKNEYMIVDYASNAFYAVIPDQRQIINLSESVPVLSSNEAPEIRFAFTPVGNGPVIAGYSTRSYRFTANGENCGTLHASDEAMKGTGIGRMLNAMSNMADGHRKALGGFAAAIPPCRQAQMSIGPHLGKIGAPLQIIDENGQVQRTINKISKNVDIDAGSYHLPADYTIISMADKIIDAQEMNSRMDQLQKHEPQMQEMMRRMQQSGRLPPEALEQMQRYQEMLQQQQR